MDSTFSPIMKKAVGSVNLFRLVEGLLIVCFLCSGCVSNAGTANPATSRNAAAAPQQQQGGRRGPSRPEKQVVHIGVILPHSNFGSRMRTYQRHLNTSLDLLVKSKLPRFNFTNYFTIEAEVVFMKVDPTPTDILHGLCKKFLTKNVSTVLYFANIEMYGSSTASTQYFLQLSGYLGIPVISWNAEFGLEQKVSKGILTQLAPSVTHQSAAMLSILKRYSWHQFSIVTTRIAGHDNFILAVRDEMERMRKDFRFILLSTVIIDILDPVPLRDKLADLQNTDTRIILLHSSKDDAVEIFRAANELGLTGKSFMWIVTRTILGERSDLGDFHATPETFPIGMLGIYFNTRIEILETEVENAVKVFGYGLELFVNDPHNGNVTLQPNLSCNDTVDARWSNGEAFAGYLRDVSIYMGGGKPNLEFKADGTVKYAELQVLNLNAQLKWEKFGTWTPFGLEVKDIVWPGNSLVPPHGVPEKFHLKVTFLEERPFINLDIPDLLTGKCINRGVSCDVGQNLMDHKGVNESSAAPTQQCCSGLSIDLLQMFATDMGFTYDLIRVDDGLWGAETNGHWNGLMAALVQHKTDIVVSSFKINSMREAVVDFSSPFMETGIAIVVAKRTGIISPKAFLEPFDTVSWVMILVVSIHMAAFAIFLFEWLSPSGYNMSFHPPSNYKFSLFRTYWMVWADLFGASVNVDCPRSFSARFMSSVWAMFAVVFLAIYTANLAAFMITREEYHNLSGIEDKRLSNPYAFKPPFRFGTVPHSSTDAVLQINNPIMHNYMKPFNRSSVAEGITAVKKGELDAFLYDATVLQYLVGQDDNDKCNLLTVGAWYAMTGYGIGFPRSSKYLAAFNKFMITYKENGDLDRLQRYWLAGVCHPEKQERSPSRPLSLDQFISAFILLSLGIFLALVLLFMEHGYFQYLRKHLAKKDAGGCCALISLSMGKSLTFRGAVYEARPVVKKHRCHDPVCDAHLYKVCEELAVARLKIQQLEKILESQDYLSRKPLEKRDALGPYDIGRNRVNTVDLFHTARRSIFGFGTREKSERTHVAERVTVL